jgi:hypothetical protein
MQGRLLEQQGRHALHRITHAVQGFVPLANALKAKYAAHARTAHAHAHDRADSGG